MEGYGTNDVLLVQNMSDALAKLGCAILFPNTTLVLFHEPVYL